MNLTQEQREEIEKMAYRLDPSGADSHQYRCR